MRIISADRKRYVDVGQQENWQSLRSTVFVNLKSYRRKIPLAWSFLETGGCAYQQAHETARQFNLLRDQLAKYAPDKIVYDFENPKAIAPWNGKISPIITSCANFFVTDDGKDMLYEIIVVLTYAGIKKVEVKAEY